MREIRPLRIARCALLLAFLALPGCAAGWWPVDQSAYEPPIQSADEVAQFGNRAPTGGSHGTGDNQQPAGTQDEGGDPAFRPRPAR